MGALFGQKPKKPEPVRMPDEEDPTNMAARRRQQAAVASRSGRTSTMLSQAGGQGGAYRNQTLGQS